MSEESFLIKKRTIGLSFNSGDRVCVFIPENTILTVVDGPLDGRSLVNVKWGDSTATIFAEDLKARGRLVPAQ